MHELPQLGKLERKYPNEIAIIGVQSAKYPAEGVPENLRHAVKRYDVEHPVVNDPDYQVWESYAVKAWPTLVFLSPTGQVIGRAAGEVPFERLDTVVSQLIQEYSREGSLDRERPRRAVESFSRPPAVLSYSGKVLAAGDRLFIADSGHHRILVADTGGAVQRIIGSGQPGFSDGDLASACFYRPQGMALAENDVLYVADAENHAIRAVDLSTGTVRTVAGTGKQARQQPRRGPAMETDLSSPWDVAVRDGQVYVAMAGLHQIWQLDLAQATVAVWAGTGHEAIRDGPREQAWFAQPMGLALDDECLYVACAESQAIRRVNLSSGLVDTLIGGGLFNFGDENGPGETALLQHPQGVAVRDGTVYVADTYNNKVKSWNPLTSAVSTFLGSGQAGTLDGPGEFARFDEPSGISIAGDTIFIADTNNHLIRSADFESGHVRTVHLQGQGIDVEAE